MSSGENELPTLVQEPNLLYICNGAPKELLSFSDQLFHREGEDVKKPG